jgi:uncharacterized protein
MLKKILLLAGQIFLFILAVSLPALIAAAFDEHFKSPILALVSNIAAIVASIYAYKFIMGWFSAPVPSGLNLENWRPRFIQGGSLGAILALAYFLFEFFGFFPTEKPTDFNFLNNFALALGISLMAGFLEEITFRGIIFGLSEKVLGTSIAIVVQAVLFGIAHILRPDVQMIDIIELTSAGLLFGAAYVVTRTLWFSIGMHFTFDWLGMLQPGAIEAMEKKGIPYTTTEIGLLMLFALVEIVIAWHMLKKARAEGKWQEPVWRIPPVPAAQVTENETA